MNEDKKQEPVAWMGAYDHTDLYYRKPPQADVIPLYTTPPQRKPLTGNDIVKIAHETTSEDLPAYKVYKFARAIEAAHGIKE